MSPWYYESMALAANGRSCTVYLQTPPLPCVVPRTVFDAFAWCESHTLEWRRPAGRWECTLHDARLDGSNPARMVFVTRRACEFLPCELARLHVFGMALEDELALAPWAIDDATDLLFERRACPEEWLWLAADNVNALFWGLHDWAHFHNHGSFTERAWTELQCDVSALAWLWINRHEAGLDEAVWEKMRSEAVSLSRDRFCNEGLRLDMRILEAHWLVHLSACAATFEPRTDG